MAAMVGKQVAKHALQSKMSENQPSGDPYFETVVVKRMGMNTTRKQWKAFDPNLTKEEVEILTKVRRRARRLDAVFRIPGIGRYGWGTVIGFIPVVGDSLELLLAALLIRSCKAVDPELPPKVKRAMYRNVTFDFLIGLVPVLGDIADAVYKCNTKNYVLLEKELVKRAKQRALGGDVSGVAAVSNSYQNYNTSGAQYQMADPYGGNPQYASNRQQRRPA